MIIKLELLHTSWWNIFSTLSQLISHIEYRVAKKPIWSGSSWFLGKQPGSVCVAFSFVLPLSRVLELQYSRIRCTDHFCKEIWPQAASCLSTCLFLNSPPKICGNMYLLGVGSNVCLYCLLLASEPIAEYTNLRTVRGGYRKSSV